MVQERAFPAQHHEHLLALLRDIERNPLRAGLVERAGAWPWLSLHPDSPHANKGRRGRRRGPQGPQDMGPQGRAAGHGAAGHAWGAAGHAWGAEGPQGAAGHALPGPQDVHCHNSDHLLRLLLWLRNRLRGSLALVRTLARSPHLSWGRWRRMPPVGVGATKKLDSDPRELRPPHSASAKLRGRSQHP